mmetsp:Transcript_48995/g.123242  ORF Transcript_48995/g.123242 Transcript_48995/m.123242 type:complete len:485 (-) Transcript_48995:62-1516(-)
MASPENSKKKNAMHSTNSLANFECNPRELRVGGSQIHRSVSPGLGRSLDPTGANLAVAASWIAFPVMVTFITPVTWNVIERMAEVKYTVEVKDKKPAEEVVTTPKPVKKDKNDRVTEMAPVGVPVALDTDVFMQELSVKDPKQDDLRRPWRLIEIKGLGTQTLVAKWDYQSLITNSKDIYKNLMAFAKRQRVDIPVCLTYIESKKPSEAENPADDKPGFFRECTYFFRFAQTERLFMEFIYTKFDFTAHPLLQKTGLVDICKRWKNIRVRMLLAGPIEKAILEREGEMCRRDIKLKLDYMYDDSGVKHPKLEPLDMHLVRMLVRHAVHVLGLPEETSKDGGIDLMYKPDEKKAEDREFDRSIARFWTIIPKRQNEWVIHGFVYRQAYVYVKAQLERRQKALDTAFQLIERMMNGVYPIEWMGYEELRLMIEELMKEQYNHLFLGLPDFEPRVGLRFPSHVEPKEYNAVVRVELINRIVYKDRDY